MKNNRFFAFLVSALMLTIGAVMTGCSDDDDVDSGYASLSLSTSSLTFNFDATSSDELDGVVEISANRNWEISIPTADQSWLSVDYSSGSGDKTVVFSVAATTSSRYSTVTISLYNDSGVIQSETIAITQGQVIDENTIAYAADIANTGKTFTDLEGTVVVLTAVSYVVVDETGGILVYSAGTPPYEVGDVVSISGTTTSYGGLSQFSNDATVVKTGTAEVDYTSPIEMSGSDMDSYLNDISVKYVKYTGTLSVSGSYLNITDISGASSAKGSLTYAPDGLYDEALEGTEVDVYGYLVGVAGTVYINTAAVCVVATGDEFELPELNFDNSGSGDSGNSGETTYKDLTGTILATDFTAENAAAAPNTAFGKYEFVWSQGTHGTSAPKYYESGDAIRMYEGNTLTVSTTDGSNISTIDFAFVSATYTNLTADSGAIDAAGQWSGSASTIVFTSNANADTSDTDQTRITSFTMDGFVGDYVAPTAFTFETLSETASDTDTNYTISDVDFVVNNISYSSTYGSITVNEGGYLYNTTPLSDDVATIVLNYSSSTATYHTATLYAGDSSNPTTEITEKSTSSKAVSYTVPAGTKYFRIESKSGYFYLVSIELSSEESTPDVTDPDPDVDEDVTLPEVEYTGTIMATDFADVDQTAAPNMIFGNYKFVWSQGTHLNSLPKYYTSGEAIRMYEGNTLTVSTTDGSNIETIDFAFVSATYTNLTADIGSIDAAGQWSGSASTIVFTSSPNEDTSGTDQTRIVSITMDGEAGEQVEPDPAAEVDIATAANVENVGTLYSVTGVVTASCTTGFVVTDETASIYVFLSNHTYSIGDTLTIEGTPSLYNGSAQFSGSSCTITAGASTSVEYSTPASYGATELNAYTSGVVYAEIEGALTVSGSYINVTVDGATKTLSVNATSVFTAADYDGKTVKLTGYVTGTYSSYIYFVATAIESISAPEVDEDADPYADYEVFDLTGTINAVDFTSADSDEAQNYIFGNYAFTWSKGSGSTIPKYYTSYGPAVRLYNGGTLTVATLDGTPIESIDLAFYSATYSDLTSDVGTLEDGAWTGSASKVVFTAGSDRAYIMTIVVDGNESEPDPVQTATIDVAANLDNVGTTYSVEGIVTATCTAGFVLTDNNASIYVYLYNHTYSVGDALTIEGATSLYSGSAQFSGSSCTITEGASVQISDSIASAYGATELNAYTSGLVYAEIEGALAVSDSKINVTVDGVTKTLSVNVTSVFTAADYDGKNVKLTGYVTGTYSSYIYFVATAIETVE